MLYGRSSWAWIQRHRFTAQAQKQEKRDNGSFFFKTPHHQVQAGHSGDQHPTKGPIVPPGRLPWPLFYLFLLRPHSFTQKWTATQLWTSKTFAFSDLSVCIFVRVQSYYPHYFQQIFLFPTVIFEGQGSLCKAFPQLNVAWQLLLMWHGMLCVWPSVLVLYHKTIWNLSRT